MFSLQTLSRLALPLLSALAMPAAHALQADYYVQFTPHIGGGGPPVVASITRGGLNGQLLTRPAGACGMLFEYADGVSWSPQHTVPAHSGTLRVWPAITDCGWDWVVIEVPGMPGQISQPQDSVGWLLVRNAQAFWIDGNGKKLIYKNPPCVANGHNNCPPPPVFTPR